MKQSDILARRRALVTRIQTEGAEAAYEAALAVCQDTKAPAPARATCATTILRAGGYLATTTSDAAVKEAHLMTPAELEARITDLRKQTSGTAAEETNNLDVFQ